MKSFVLAIFLSFALFESANAVCCPWTVTSDVKCACGDGGLVHPWECCSTGTCNIFCCNCGGPCRKNTTDEIIELPKSIYDALNSERVKRSAYAEFSPVDFNTALHFNVVDANQDLKIDLQEALNHLGNSRNSLFLRFRNAFTPAWFIKMDTDQNEIITPEEFDMDLTDDILKQFHTLYYEVV